MLVIGWWFLFVTGFYLTEVTQTPEDAANLSNRVIVSPHQVRLGHIKLLDDRQVFWAPFVDIRVFLVIQVTLGIAFMLFVRMLLAEQPEDRFVGVRRWLRGGAIVALAAGMFNATLSYGPTVERSVAPNLAVGLSWTAAEEEQWKGLGMYFPPTLLVRGTEQNPLLVMGLYEREGYDKTLPSFTLWIDGMDGIAGRTDWARPLGGSCRTPTIADGDGGALLKYREDPAEPRTAGTNRRDGADGGGDLSIDTEGTGTFGAPSDSFTCKIAPASDRDTEELLPFFPDGLPYDPVVIELDFYGGGYYATARGEGQRFHAVGIDSYGGAGAEVFEAYGQRRLFELPTATTEDSNAGIRATYLATLGGSKAQSVVGFRSQVELGVAYAYQWEDAYLEDVKNGEATRTSDLLVFYGEDQQDAAWVASWSERRRSKDAAQQVADAVSIALLGGFVAFFVAAAPTRSRSSLAAAAGGAISSLRGLGRGK